MNRKKGNFTDKVLDRLDKLTPENLQACLLGLIKERGFLENVFNAIHEAVIVVDQQLNIRYTNKASFTLLGVNNEAIGSHIGKYLKTLNWDELLPNDETRWWNAARRELEVFYPEHRFLSFYVMPLAERTSNDPFSELPFATLIFNDITDVTEENFRHVETQKVKAITMLAAGVAHELGNPLNSLGIHLQLLKRNLGKCELSKERDKAMEHLEIAQQEIARLDSIVKNFLSAVRPVPPQMMPLDIEAILREAIGFMQNEIENRAIWVELTLPDSIPLLLGDKDQLMQAAYNLIKNAIQAMPDGGRIDISVNVDDIFVNIRFADTGCGFDQTQISNLMEAYFTTKSSGHGLGLLIVDRIVRAHGGELTIEGSPGKGAAFTISLPRQSRMVRQLHG
ncbi:MAG: PAS domain-containing protein [Victivallales bacterium]|nr:PAS domain-containing protein [Victivallales bacterium]